MGMGWIASSALRASTFNGQPPALVAFADDVDPARPGVKLDALPGERDQRRRAGQCSATT
jgi:hypothetical protein